MQTDIIKRPPPEPETRSGPDQRQTPVQNQPDQSKVPKQTKADVVKPPKKSRKDKKDNQKPEKSVESVSPKTNSSSRPMGVIFVAIFVCLALIGLTVYSQISNS